MKTRGKTAGEILDESFRLFSEVAHEEIAESQEQTLKYLELQVCVDAEEKVLDSRPVSALRKLKSLRFAAFAAFAAFAVLGLALSTTLVRPLWRSDQPAVVQAVGGNLFRISRETSQVLHAGDSLEFGETIHSTGRAGTILSLMDGSVVEMRSKSELGLEAADDGLRIRLNAGNIIVTAAKQRKGHLYVQTKDILVSVVGTLFLVNAEEEGSRVAVIEGEVRVQHGATERTLLPGEQLATNPSMEQSPVKAEVILPVQQSAVPVASPIQEPPETFEVILAMLQQADEAAAEARQMAARIQQHKAAVAASNQGRLEKFEVASIRPTAPATPVAGGRGGGGGVPKGSPCLFRNLVELDPGRLRVKQISLRGLIAAAYGVSCRLPAGISGGPEWTESESYDIEAVIPAGSPIYTRTDLAEGNAPELQRMLQNLLADRFKLILRRDMKEMAAYNVVVSKPGTWECRLPAICHGLRLSEDQSPDGRSLDREGRTAIPTSLNLHTSISSWMAVVTLNTGRPAIDRTGLKGYYDIRLEYPVTYSITSIEGLSRLDTDMQDRFVSTIQEQLGFRLEPTKALMQVLDIEHVERLSPN